MDFSVKFNAKAMEGSVRDYLDNLDLGDYLENELAGKGIPRIHRRSAYNEWRAPCRYISTGSIFKDLWYRFNTLQKKKVIFRAGWDTQGLPVELQAEKGLGLTGSEAENVGKVGDRKKLLKPARR